MPVCSCQVHCKGGRNISESSFRRHKKFRDPASTFSVEFGAFIASQSRCDTVNDDFDDDFGIGGLFEAGNELGNVEPADIEIVEHRIGSLGL
jgi:hypothetical protein